MTNQMSNIISAKVKNAELEDMQNYERIFTAQIEFEKEREKRIVEKVTAKVLDAVRDLLGENYGTNTNKDNQGEEWLTQREICERYKLSLTTINRRQHEGILKPRYVGRKALYNRAEIEEYLNRKG